MDIRLDNLDALSVTRGELMRNFQCGTFSEIIDICFERQTIASHFGIRMFFDKCDRALNR